MSRRIWIPLLVVAALAVAVAVVAVALPRTGPVAPAEAFVTRDGSRLMLDGKPFAVAGSNNYRPMFLEPPLVDEIMKTAADNNLTVMRVWGFNDIGNADGTNSVDTANTPRYFHYWDGDSPAYNDGEDGLQRLDYVVASAKRHNVRLVIPFVNNWASFGGMDQYVRWAGARYHSDFYTDPTIRQWYQDWVRHLLERTNVHTGVRYKDEPTIAVFELANEARCQAAGQYPRSPDCTTDTITSWVTEMAAYVKSIDSRHLLGFGDEGFMCDEGADHFAYDCSQGVDAAAIARLDDIDLVGLHLYPDHWKTDPQWATEYIKRHVALADEVGKPLFLGEYGWRGDAPRNIVFHQWLSAFHAGGGDIALYWMMQPRSEALTPLDQDGFTAYCPSPVCTQVSYWSQALLDGRTDFPPVADEDFLVAAAAQPVTIDVLASDVSPLSRLDRATVDLDPGTSGVQATVTLPAGAVVVVDGTVTYTPAAGFTGTAEIPYTVNDVEGRTSNVATLTIRISDV